MENLTENLETELRKLLIWWDPTLLTSWRCDVVNGKVCSVVPCRTRQIGPPRWEVSSTVHDYWTDGLIKIPENLEQKSGKHFHHPVITNVYSIIFKEPLIIIPHKYHFHCFQIQCIFNLRGKSFFLIPQALAFSKLLRWKIKGQ